MIIQRCCEDLARAVREIEVAVVDRRSTIQEYDLDVLLRVIPREAATLAGLAERIRIEYQSRELSKALKVKE